MLSLNSIFTSAYFHSLARIALPGLLLLSACEPWGTMNEAEKIYRTHKEEFLRIYDITQMHKELRHISPAYLPDENMGFNEQYGELTSASKTSYLDILRLMEKSKATRTRIERFQSAQGGNVEFVRILIFSRGIGATQKEFGWNAILALNQSRTFATTMSCVVRWTNPAGLCATRGEQANRIRRRCAR